MPRDVLSDCKDNLSDVEESILSIYLSWLIFSFVLSFLYGRFRDCQDTLEKQPSGLCDESSDIKKE